MLVRREGMDVPFRDLDTAMPHQFLHGDNIDPGLKQAGAKGELI